MGAPKYNCGINEESDEDYQETAVRLKSKVNYSHSIYGKAPLETQQTVKDNHKSQVFAGGDTNLSDESDNEIKAKRQAQKKSIYNRAPTIDVESAGVLKSQLNMEHAKNLLNLAARSTKKKKATLKKLTVSTINDDFDPNADPSKMTMPQQLQWNKRRIEYLAAKKL